MTDSSGLTLWKKISRGFRGAQYILLENPSGVMKE
jgi:hypothetical protein